MEGLGQPCDSGIKITKATLLAQTFVKKNKTVVSSSFPGISGLFPFCQGTRTQTPSSRFSQLYLTGSTEIPECCCCYWTDIFPLPNNALNASSAFFFFFLIFFRDAPSLRRLLLAGASRIKTQTWKPYPSSHPTPSKNLIRQIYPDVKLFFSSRPLSDRC